MPSRRVSLGGAMLAGRRSAALVLTGSLVLLLFLHESDLSLRPIWHQREHRVKAQILVCFLAYVLWRTLEQGQQRAGPMGLAFPDTCTYVVRGGGTCDGAVQSQTREMDVVVRSEGVGCLDRAEGPLVRCKGERRR